MNLIREQDIGKLVEFFECRRGVFSVTDGICPLVFDNIDGSASRMLCVLAICVSLLVPLYGP